MTEIEIRNAVLDILRGIVAEDFDEIVPDRPFQEQLALDSMDFLDVIMDLRKKFRIDIPEEEYTCLTTLNDAVEYLTPILGDSQFAVSATS
jgi:acyl carrier protein